MDKSAAADVGPRRQRTQYTCMTTSMTMCLHANGMEATEDEVNKVMGAKPMQGASWEQAFAAAQHYGMRVTFICPATLKQIKEYTDRGVPVMIAWNPEGRPWSHASVVFDVDDEMNVSVADPNIPDPDETVRMVTKTEFYGKWYEKWPDYMVRRPAMAVEREVTSDGRQMVASQKRLAGRVYPWEMRQELKDWQRKLTPQEVEEGSDRGGPFSGFAPGAIPGGKGVFTVLHPEDFQKAEGQGWVTSGKSVKFYRVTTGSHSSLDVAVVDRILTTLTKEGQRLVDTPIKDLVLKRPSLSGKWEKAAQVFEALMEATTSGDGQTYHTLLRVLEDHLYKSEDFWRAENTKWYKGLATKFPNIVTPSVYDEIFRRPLTLTGWVADLWDLLDTGQGYPDQYNRYLTPGGPDDDFLAQLIFQAYADLAQDKMQDVLGAARLRKIRSLSDIHIKPSVKKDLRGFILQHFPDKLTANLKEVLEGKSPSEKVVVDSGVATKIEILDRLIEKSPPAAGMAKGMKELYLSGKTPSEDQLKFLRSLLYRSQMRQEADNFRVGSEDELLFRWFMAKKAPQNTTKTQDEKKREQNKVTIDPSTPRSDAQRKFIEDRAKGTGGAGVHKNRDKAVEDGRSRKEKHKKDWTEKEACLTQPLSTRPDYGAPDSFGALFEEARQAAYDGNPDGEPIYPKNIDHGVDTPLSGGTDVVQQLQNDLLDEQGNSYMKRKLALRFLSQG